MHAEPRHHIRCILFDLGNTLWQHSDPATWALLEEDANASALRLLRASLGSGSAPAQHALDLGRTLRQQIESGVHAAHQLSPFEEPDFAQVALAGLRAAGIVQTDLAVGAAVYEALRIRASRSRVLLPDTVETLRALKSRGYLLGVVTNRHYGGQPFLDDLGHMGLLEFFAAEHVAISADLGNRKPHPAIFWHALDALGMPPALAAMVGDKLTADIYGAQQLGLFTVWKPRPAHELAGHAAATERDEEATLRRAPVAIGQADGSNASNAALFAEARQREGVRHPYVARMAPPNAIIAQVSDLLRIFGDAAPSR